MQVFHTSNMPIKHPEEFHFRRNLDFGSGFYFTPLREQAEKYATRFFRQKEQAWLNVYDFEADYSKYKVKSFDIYNEEWLDFVTSCRVGKTIGDYDLVVGGIANDKVFDTINLYFDRLIPKAEALSRLAYEKPNIQYCIRSSAMLKACLIFKEAIKL